jgi:ADP-ribosylglycohydrolase
MGGTVGGFLARRKAGHHWDECGPKSAGNGALMRIAPILIPHLRTATPDLWVDTALAAMLTHNDSASLSACLAFVRILWDLLAMTTPPAPEWWWQTYVATARDLEADDTYTPRGGEFTDYRGTLWRFVEERVPEAWGRAQSTLRACNSWHSGAYLLETVPSVLYILMKHASDPAQAIVRAVNDTKDNDTIAAIVGAAVGALHGKSGLPARWVSGLSGRTEERDDGRIFTLLAEARRTWG